MRGGREQAFASDIARSTSTITGMPRRRASTQRSVQKAAQRLLGQDGGRNLPARCRGRAAGPSTIRIAEGDDGALAARVDHDVGDRRHQARHVHDDVGCRCLPARACRNILGRRSRGRRPSDRRSRRGRRDARSRSRHSARCRRRFLRNGWRFPWSRAPAVAGRGTSGRAPACRCRECAEGLSVRRRGNSCVNPSCRFHLRPEPAVRG